MATAKKQPGAPTPAERKRQKSDERAAKSKAWREGHAKEMAAIRAPTQIERKPVKTPGVQDAGLQVQRGGIGRPPIVYTPDLAEKLFEYISTGLSLEKISRIEGMPSVSVLLRWIGSKDHAFSFDYVRAKALLVPLYEERALDAALEPEYGELRTTRDDPMGGSIEVRQVEMTEHRKLKLAAYQWALSHMIPKKHGRNPADSGSGPNEQLNALFESLKIEG